MACFLVPLGEAIVTTVVQKVVEKRRPAGPGTTKGKFAWKQRLGLLNKMLWGGSALLAFEHLWHGEIVPWPPFLTAMRNPADVAPMLHEIATIGLAMALVTTAVWAVIVLVVETKSKAIGESQSASATRGVH